MIHVVTSKSEPERHIELNEQWVLGGGAETPAYGGMDGRQSFSYPNGQKQWDVTYKAGRKTGVETWWSDSGRRQWECEKASGLTPPAPCNRSTKISPHGSQVWRVQGR